MRKPYCSSASTVALKTSGCTFPRLFVDHWLVRSMYSFPSTSTRVEPLAPERTMLVRRVSSDQKYFGMSSRYRFQYRAPASFEPVRGPAAFDAIATATRSPQLMVMEPRRDSLLRATVIGPLHREADTGPLHRERGPHRPHAAAARGGPTMARKAPVQPRGGRGDPPHVPRGRPRGDGPLPRGGPLRGRDPRAARIPAAPPRPGVRGRPRPCRLPLPRIGEVWSGRS